VAALSLQGKLASAEGISRTCGDLGHLTTPHKLQGRGALGKPSPGTARVS